MNLDDYIELLIDMFGTKIYNKCSNRSMELKLPAPCKEIMIDRLTFKRHFADLEQCHGAVCDGHFCMKHVREQSYDRSMEV